MRIRVGIAVLTLVAAACTSDRSDQTEAPSTTATGATATTTTTTTATSEPPTSEPSTTSSSTTTSGPPQQPFAEGADVALATSTECPGLTDASATGAVTWSDSERLWEAGADGAALCLFHVDGMIESIQWGPRGDRALVNGKLIVGGPANGQVAPSGVDWAFTLPAGQNMIGLGDGGTLTEWQAADDDELVFDALAEYEAVAYHPSGLHIAAGGTDIPDDSDLDPTEGIFITGRDGTTPVNLVLGTDVEILDIAFSNDASTIYFIASHDELVHLHSHSVIPMETDDGGRQLGAGAEDEATTMATSSGGGRVEFEALIVHPSDPELVIWTTDECAPEGSRGFQVFGGGTASVVQALGPAAALGFVGGDATVVSVAAISGPCDGLRDVGLMMANLETGVVDSLPLAGDASAAAVRAVAAPHQHDLVDVEIAGFS